MCFVTKSHSNGDKRFFLHHNSLLIGLEAVLKTFLGFKVKAGASVQPQEYSKYFED